MLSKICPIARFSFMAKARMAQAAALFLRKLPYAALNRHLRKMLTVKPLLKLTHAALWYFTLYDSPMQLPLELPLKNITDSCKERLQHLNKSFCTLTLIVAQ